MKKFVEANSLKIVTALTLVIASLVLVIGKTKLNDVIDLSDLPGPRAEISERSKKEINTILGPNGSVVGVWVSRITYSKTENPLIWYGASTRKFDEATRDYIQRQEEGLNLSSKEIQNSGAAVLRNTQAAKVGDISCAPINMTGFPRIAPKSVEIANVVCRAPIPPFNPTANMVLVVMIDAASVDDKKVEAIRKLILQLQIDIYNRDFLAREIWIHE